MRPRNTAFLQMKFIVFLRMPYNACLLRSKFHFIQWIVRQVFLGLQLAFLFYSLNIWTMLCRRDVLQYECANYSFVFKSLVDKAYPKKSVMAVCRSEFSFQMRAFFKIIAQQVKLKEKHYSMISGFTVSLRC